MKRFMFMFCIFVYIVCICKRANLQCVSVSQQPEAVDGLFVTVIKSTHWCLYSLFGLQKGGVMELCGGDREEERNVKEGAKPIDPLLQLITLFSRSALTERRWVYVCVCSL